MWMALFLSALNVLAVQKICFYLWNPHLHALICEIPGLYCPPPATALLTIRSLWSSLVLIIYKSGLVCFYIKACFCNINLSSYSLCRLSCITELFSVKTFMFELNFAFFFKLWNVYWILRPSLLQFHIFDKSK